MNYPFKISIIIPFYNGHSFYPSVMKSISRSLLASQHFSFSYEVITIIDSMESAYDEVLETAKTAFDKLENVSIVVKKNSRNIGVAGSRNLAMSIGRGEYFHIIDQDDLVTENFYLQVIPLLPSFNFVLVNGMVYYTDKKYNAHKLYYLTPNLSLKGLLTDDFIRSPGQVVFLRSLCSNISFPEPKYNRGADDRFFWIRMLILNSKVIKPYYIATPHYIANIHDDNYSNDTINLKKSAIEGWDMMSEEIVYGKNKSLIQKDKVRLNYGVKNKLSKGDKVLGFWYNIKYFLTLNKLIRFVVKRKSW
jgi:hypothetical protein